MTAIQLYFLSLFTLLQALLAGGGGLQVLDVLSGDESKIEITRVEMVRTPQQWRVVWADHRGFLSTGGASPLIEGSTPPAVDFSKSQVLAIFGGITKGVEGYQVADVTKDGAKDVLRLAPVLRPGAGQSLAGTPFLIAVVTKTKRPLVIQMALGRDRWRTIAEFDVSPER